MIRLPAWLRGPARPDTAAALREARAACGWSQREMANALAVSLRTYEGWEGGRPCAVWPTIAQAVGLWVAVKVGDKAAAAWWRSG